MALLCARSKDKLELLALDSVIQVDLSISALEQAAQYASASKPTASNSPSKPSTSSSSSSLSDDDDLVTFMSPAERQLMQLRMGLNKKANAVTASRFARFTEADSTLSPSQHPPADAEAMEEASSSSSASTDSVDPDVESPSPDLPSPSSENDDDSSAQSAAAVASSSATSTPLSLPSSPPQTIGFPSLRYLAIINCSRLGSIDFLKHCPQLHLVCLGGSTFDDPGSEECNVFEFILNS